VSRTRYFALCCLALAGAFAGGYAANRAIPVAHAQTLPPAELRGTSFVLVNPQGQALATMRGGISGAELLLNDPQGNLRVKISPSSGLVIRDANGRITWRSPSGSGLLLGTPE
jgi:hypothetical protein